MHIGNHRVDRHAPFILIAGPCQIESHAHAFDMAGSLKELCETLGIGFIYKSSFDKANRTSIGGKRGLGLERSLEIFASLRKDLNIALTTDVHLPEHCAILGAHVDMLQIPAFLCRQTDLLIAAAKTGLAVNVKKGQFLAPWDMQFVVEKIRAQGNQRILLTERGTSFGYNSLVSDLRALPIMADTGCPIIFDATHSVQMPGGRGGSSGGERQFAPLLARAAVAVGVAGVFIETHQDPANAPSDGDVMIPLAEMKDLMEELQEIDQLRKNKMQKQNEVR